MPVRHARGKFDVLVKGCGEIRVMQLGRGSTRKDADALHVVMGKKGRSGEKVISPSVRTRRESRMVSISTTRKK